MNKSNQAKQNIKKPCGMYSETPKINVGNFKVSLMGGAGNGLWIENNEGKGGQFYGPCLETAIKKLWEENF